MTLVNKSNMSLGGIKVVIDGETLEDMCKSKTITGTLGQGMDRVMYYVNDPDMGLAVVVEPKSTEDNSSDSDLSVLIFDVTDETKPNS